MFHHCLKYLQLLIHVCLLVQIFGYGHCQSKTNFGPEKLFYYLPYSVSLKGLSMHINKGYLRKVLQVQ